MLRIYFNTWNMSATGTAHGTKRGRTVAGPGVSNPELLCWQNVLLHHLSEMKLTLKNISSVF